MADYSFPPRPLRRTYACPACGALFQAVNTKGGKECPAGHWHSLYHLNYFATHARLPEPRPKKGAKSKSEARPKSARRALQDVGISSRPDQCALALQWWLESYERLLTQLPASPAQALVTGIFGRTYQLSRQLVR